MDKHKLILPVSILLGCIILGGFYYASQMKKQLSIQPEKHNQEQQEGKCYSYENRKCITKVEKEIIKLLPNNAILREIEPIPLLDRNEYIGIYIENPIVAATSTDNYLSCADTVRGQTITGIYHLFTYSFGNFSSDLIIPKSTSLEDYNSSLSAQNIGMSWKNTKYNNFNYFNGKPYLKDEEYNLEISNLINFKDYNGDGYPYEFILYGGEYWTCSDDENLVAGYDEANHSAIIYKIRSSSNKFTYWDVNFIPRQDGSVINHYGCGDHGSDEEITIYYKYNFLDKFYYFTDRALKKCY